MKVAIIQISDIHLASSKDFIISRMKLIAKSARTVTDSCDKIIMAIAGDIANKGRTEEYAETLSFFNKLEKEILKNNDVVKNIDYIIVPGNHDCSLSNSEPLRDALISSALKDTSSVHEQISTVLLEAQKGFWEFSKELTGREIQDRVSHEISFKLNDEYTITFLCYNTSLCTKIHEVVGGLMVPEDKFLQPSVDSQNNITISIFHHNSGWLSPSTNNKKLFEKHIFETSDIVICGHEHDRKERLENNLKGEEQLVYLEGAAFQYGSSSEYYINVIDTETLECEKHTLKYQHSVQPDTCLYRDTIEMFAIRNKFRGLQLRKDFEDKLQKLPIKITHPVVGDLRLSDCYIFPDLEPELNKEDEYGAYLDSEDLAKNKKQNTRIFIIEGASRCGKSSLLKMFYLCMLKTGIYPIILKGKDISDLKQFNGLLEKNYKQQYDYKSRPYDFYKQLERSKKVLLIDNLNRSSLNRDSIQTIYKSSLSQFETIIVTTDERLKMSQILPNTELKDTYRQYRILSFGSIKRNLLIEKWQRLGANYETLDDRTLEQEVKEIFDIVSSILGEQFLSPYPFYLLSLLQNLNQAAKRQEVHQTYYAYCYKSLLISSLDSVEIEPEKQKQLLAFLAYIAYKQFEKK